MSDDYHLPQEEEIKLFDEGFERAGDKLIDIDQMIIDGLTKIE